MQRLIPLFHFFVIWPSDAIKALVSISQFLIMCVACHLSFSSVAIASTAAQDNSQQTLPTSQNGNKNVQCPSILQHNVTRLQDEKELSLCQYSGQVVLIVNTASYCGFTPQYKGLEALYDKYKSRGLVVLGFPSNDFSQEPDSNNQIADFCENTFGVKFPMFTKTSVKGGSASPLFKQLTQRTQTSPKWNFYKYLVSRDGQSIKSFNSMTSPDDKAFIAEVQKQLDIQLP